MTSSHVSAAVIHGRSDTQRTPRPSTTNVAQRDATRASRGIAAQHAAEDGVVPVHRPAVLVEEHVGTVRDRDGERAERQLPVGTVVPEPLGDRERALQAVVDARRPGEQGAVVGVVAAPRDLAGLALEVEGEVDRGLDRRPEPAQVRGVAGDEVVVPRAGRDVTGDVGVEGGILDVVAEVVRVPAAVGALHPGQPVVGGARLVVPSTEVEGHRGLDHVPRVGVAARDPGDVAVGQLDRRDGVDRLEQLGRGDDAVDVGEQVLSRHVSRPSACRRRGSCRAPG